MRAPVFGGSANAATLRITRVLAEGQLLDRDRRALVAALDQLGDELPRVALAGTSRDRLALLLALARVDAVADDLELR